MGEGIKKAFSDAFDWVVNKAKAVGSTLRSLPVIKQLGDLGEYIADKVGGDDGDGADHSDEGDTPANLTKQALRAAQQINNPGVNIAPGAPGAAAEGSGQGIPAVAFGATNINIYGVKDAADASNKLGEAVAIKNRQAAAALTGSKK